MSKLIAQCIFLTILFLQLDCGTYENRPKIQTSNGDLIIEPALNKNIYLRPKGRQSTIFVGDVDILKINITSSIHDENSVVNSDFSSNSLQDILRRLQRLENQKTVSTTSRFNVSLLVRRVQRINTRILALTSRINGLSRDDCSSHPCLNGGTCLNLGRGYHCLCPSNWEGKNCDSDVNECRNFLGTDLGCQNGATCINRPGSYECLCRSGWYGIHCTRRSKDCSGGSFEMCGHGSCIDVKSGDGIKCICDQGWTNNITHIECVTDINECDSSHGARCSTNPKVDCINLPGSFRCGPCPTGYEGDGFICSDIDECATSNGGCSSLVPCFNTIGSRICGHCPLGYVGDGVTCSWRGSCKDSNGGCHPSARCIDNPSTGGTTSLCICPAGMDGDGVGFQGCYISGSNNSSQSCINNPCGSHGKCHQLSSAYTCICDRGYTGAHCESAMDYCSVNPCNNGGICRQDDTDARGYRCECTAMYSGDNCQLMKSCGELLVAEEGSIVYPLVNSSYNNNARCAWVIKTSADKVVNVTFNKFDIEYTPDCTADFLQIHDGRNSGSQLIGRFCGNIFPKGGNIISSHNSLYFWFRSDSSLSRKGFSLHWNSINPVCGGTINAITQTHGHISSPGSPGKYPPNRDCYWHIYTNLNKRLQLHFYELDIASTSSDCSDDYLSIYDGQFVSDPLINKYCNSSLPAPVTSAGSDIFIHFHSDANKAANGFQISYHSVAGVPGCGGFFTGERGELSSPSINGKYMNDLICEYVIKTSPDTKIRIDFQSFNLEKSAGCRYDFLKIYDGPSADSPIVGRFCGKNYPKTYMSSSNQLYLKFQSDHSMFAEGFKIVYQSICHKTFIGDSGIIKTPGYPLRYPENKVCEYIIKTNPGRAIVLTFQDFDVEGDVNDFCFYDNVQVRDGPDENSTLLGKFCGTNIPPPQTSSFNYMYIKFTSDMSISGTGFYANYTTVDTHCGGVYRDLNGSISHPPETSLTYGRGETCVWILVAPIGYHIIINWNRFDLEKFASCDNDYLELVEIDEHNVNHTIDTFCGKLKPPTLTTFSNKLLIKFVSDSSIQLTGFSFSYTFLEGNSQCGGEYYRSHGVLYSPGWPQNYEPSRDCTWIIKVPNGQIVTLNVTAFNLERPIYNNRCDLGDYIEIRNGASVNSTLIGKYCGTKIPKRIQSMGNAIFIKFHSDNYISGAGFSIEWDGSVTGCGGTLTSSTGIINSPNYPEHYYENAECFYRIVVNHGSIIRIVFTDIQLEKTLRCRDDYVEVRDGRDGSAPSLGKYCSRNGTTPNEIRTTSNYAFIKFRSDGLIGGRGFSLSYLTECYNINITGSHGVIESPEYPNVYPKSMTCLWNIIVPKGNTINVTFTHFNVDSSYVTFANSIFAYRKRNIPRCLTDKVQLLENGDMRELLCGISLPKKYSTHGNTLQIKFSTGLHSKGTGFQLEWAKYGCGGHIQRPRGSVTYDASSLTTDEVECDWLIETLPGTSISMTFSELYMMKTPNCTDDFIEIYSGQSVKFPLLTKICNSGKPQTLVASGNYMLIRFVKRSSVRGAYFVGSFYSVPSVCGGEMRLRSGIIYSKNYPNNYDNNLNCLWVLTVPINHRVEFNIMDLDLNSGDDEDNKCGDQIQLYDNFTIGSNYTQLICPDSNVTQIVSKTNSLAVQFITDGRSTAKGFKANFTITCGAIINVKFDGILASDDFVSDRNCTWTIIAPDLSQKVSLTITHMSISKDKDILTNKQCPSTFLQVLDGDDESAPLVGEYCGRKVPPTIVSRGNELTVIFGSYSSVVSGKFTAHYSVVDNSCGGVLSSEEGSIVSPNYPRSYPMNADCEWTLSTSPGNRVYITFEGFNLEDSENCNEDYLEIRDTNAGGRLLGVYCGDTIPINTTVSSKLFIKFHSDSDDSKQGFVLHYGFLHGNEITDKDEGVIASPLFPHTYDGQGEYYWRISTSGSQAILLSIKNMEIPNFGPICQNYLSIYDGYDDNAPLLSQFCGSKKSNNMDVTSSSNMVFIKLSLDETNTGSIFFLQWRKVDSNFESSEHEDVNCGNNTSYLISPGFGAILKSSNYPQSYSSNQNCEWFFKTHPGRHLSIKFNAMDLEESSGCIADSVSIFSADSDEKIWKPVTGKLCLPNVINTSFNASRHMKVKFVTDASVNRNGFEAVVHSLCGGSVMGQSGILTLNYEEWKGNSRNCEWVIKVRSGRTIKLHFLQFNITNSEQLCINYVTLRNGDSVDAPFLGSGKYCGYDSEKMTNLSTSSNSVFVSYKVVRGLFQNFILKYEEENVRCGGTSTLNSYENSEIINSPNYPLVPVPYTECIWIMNGPPGEILRVDVIDRFDLEKTTECDKEFLEVRDGSTEISPLIGRFCRERPGSLKSTSNRVYIRYVTQLAEPRNGFKANISIDTCGGTIMSSHGEIQTPNYPHPHNLPYGTVCEWRIIGTEELIYNVKMLDIDLPIFSKSRCDTKITIEESIPTNNTNNVLASFCSHDSVDKHPTSVIETSSNEFIVKMLIGKPDDWNLGSEHHGFRLSFNSSRPFCGGHITAAEGFLLTPGYPRDTTIRFCSWYITVPNKSRRVKLVIQDDITSYQGQTIFLYNDLSFKHTTIMDTLSSVNSTLKPKVYESSGNKMGVYVWKSGTVAGHRFKAKFTSDDSALCGGTISDNEGEIVSPNLERSYICEWQYKNSLSTLDNNYNYSTVFIEGTVHSSESSPTGTRCRYLDPTVRLTFLDGKRNFFSRSSCGSDVKWRVPLPIFDLKASQGKGASLTFNLKYKIQPCGGNIYIGEESTNVLNLPNNFNESLDCAWTIISSFEQAELEVVGSFRSDCENEFLIIGTAYYSNVAEYCRDKLQESPLTVNFKVLMVEYHTDHLNNDIKLMVKRRNTKETCGGQLSHIRTFSSPNFPKSYDANENCSWIITSDLGSRVSLQFIQRFMIQDTPNCTKDSVTIYDFRDDTFIELAKLCGREIPQMFNSTGNKMKVTLITDSEINADGFKAIWSPICGTKTVATKEEQIIYSPGYPAYYFPLKNCEYEISAPDQHIMVKFLEFNVEGPYPSCNYDNLTIQGENGFEDIQNVYCGDELPPEANFFDKVLIKFRTDRYIQRKGFKIAYSLFSCGDNVTQPTVISYGQNKEYEANLNCSWYIEAPKDKIVVIKFLQIDLESSTQCFADYLSVFEGFETNKDKRLALLCGKINATTVLRSTGNRVLLQFVTDEYINFKGFKAEIFFSYSTGVGCGGVINTESSSVITIKSPLINGSVVYENYLDCHWTLVAPLDRVIQIEFISFHVAPCRDVNQTAIGYNQCDCDFVEILDGPNPRSFVIGTYCGHTLPPKLSSSQNQLGIRFSTDGELSSAGFELRVTTGPLPCGQNRIEISDTMKRITTPGYEKGIIPRGLHCQYVLHSGEYNYIHLRIRNLDLQTGSLDRNTCDRDRIILQNIPATQNQSLGKDLILSDHGINILFNSLKDFDYTNVHDYETRFPFKYLFCGKKSSIDLYFLGDVQINVITNSETDTAHKGVDIEVNNAEVCIGNYTEPAGRIRTLNRINIDDMRQDCYTLITASEQFTISLYFVTAMRNYGQSDNLFEIYDGNTTTSNKLIYFNTTGDYDRPAFSTGRYMLLHYRADYRVNFDLNYITTDKGRGCGGKLQNIVGVITSPMYPDTHRQVSTCEWELETPEGTILNLYFKVFDLGRVCEYNYVEIVDRKGQVFASYCSEMPAIYKSNDNYAKIVFRTNRNNAGSGWVAEFIGLIN